MFLNKSCSDRRSSMDQRKAKTNEESDNITKDLATFSEATTMHGIRHLASRDTLLVKKVIWVAVLLGMLIGLAASFQHSIRTYYKFESVVSTKIKRNHSLPFPAVSVCNFNLAKASSFATYWPELIPYGLIAAQLFNGLGMPEANENETRLLVEIMEHIKFMPFLAKAGPSAEETFVECILGISQENCSQYISMLFTDGGMCFTFNSDEYTAKNGLMQARLPGNVYGMKIVLDINPDDYLVSGFLGKGMQVLVHHPYQYPRLNLKRFVIEAGKEYFVSLKLQENIVLPTPYSSVDCVPEEEVQSQIKEKSFGVRYSEDGCLAKCMTDQVYNCDCDILSTGEDACSLYTFYTCSTKNFQTYQRYGINCSQCLPTCLTTTYDYSLSSADFPSQLTGSYAQERGWPLTNITEFKNRYSRLMIYFETLQYTVIEQLPAMSLVELLSNIGGQLGLYLGASLVTLMEIVDFLIGLCSKMCKKRKQVASSTTVQHIAVIPRSQFTSRY